MESGFPVGGHVITVENTLEHTSAAFWIKGVAVFSRHLLAQTLGRPVLPVPVLVVLLLGAGGPGIPENSRVCVPGERLQFSGSRRETGWKRIRDRRGAALGRSRGSITRARIGRETRQVISRPSQLIGIAFCGHCLILRYSRPTPL